MNVQTIWKEALNRIQVEVSTIAFDLWINSLEPIDFKDKTFYLSTTCETAKIRIEKTLLPHIENALKELSKEIFALLRANPGESPVIVKCSKQNKPFKLSVTVNAKGFLINELHAYIEDDYIKVI